MEQKEKIILLLCLILPFAVQADPPAIRTPAPVIYLADNLDEQDKLGWCIDTKGRGFSGVFRRFNYGGAPASHGHHESYRGTGSIGMHTYPGRVLKGMGMPGRMGGKTKHLKNLEVVRVDVENNVLLLKGSVPGANGGLLRIFKS